MKTIKRILALFLAALLLATAAPLSFAEEDMPGYMSWDHLCDLGLTNENQAAYYFSFQGGTISTPGGVRTYNMDFGEVLDGAPSDGWTMFPTAPHDCLECSEIHLPRVLAPAGYVFAGWRHVLVFEGGQDQSVYQADETYTVKPADIGRVSTFEAVFEEDPGYLHWSQLDMLLSDEQAAFYFSFPGGRIAEPGGVPVFNCQTGELEENQYPSDGWTMVPVSGSGYDTRYDSTIHLPRVQAPAGFVFAGWERVPMDYGDADSSVYQDSYTVKMHDTGRVATFKAVYEGDNGYRPLQVLQDQGMMSEDQAAFYFAFPGGTISEPGGVQVYDFHSGLFDVNEHPSEGWTMFPTAPHDCLECSEIHLPRVMPPSGFVFAGWKRVPKVHGDLDDSVYQDAYTIKNVDIDGRITVFEAVFQLDQSYVPWSALRESLNEDQSAFYFMFPGGTISEPGGVQVFDTITGDLKNVYEYPSDGWTKIPTTLYECTAGTVVHLPRVLAPAGFVFGGWKRVSFSIAEDWDNSVYQNTYTVKPSDIARVVAFEAVFEPDPALVPWTLLNSSNCLTEEQAAFYFAFPGGTIAEPDGVRVFDAATGVVNDNQYPSDGWTMVPTEPYDCLVDCEIYLPRVNAPAGFTFTGWKRVPFVEQDFDDAVYTDTYTVRSSDIDGRYGVFEAVYEPLPSTGDYTLSGGESMRLTLRRGEETIFTCTAEEARYYKLTWDVLTNVSASTGKIKYNLYDNSMKKVIDIGMLFYNGNIRGIPLLEGESASFGLSFDGYDDIGDTIDVNVTLWQGDALPPSGVSEGGLAYTFSQDGTLSLNGDFDCAEADTYSALSMIDYYHYAIKRLEIGAGVTNFFEFFNQDPWKLLLAECEAIVPAEDHPQYVYNDGMILNRDQTTLFLWWDRNNTEDVRIPEGVKTISPLAFSPTLLFGLSGIDDYVGAIYDYQLPPMPNNVIAPSTLEAIGDAAFANCFTLNEVSGTDGLRYIGEGAFADCAALSEMPYSDKLEEIGAGAFNNCWTLQSASIPDSTITIGETAFSGCVFLKDVFIGNGVKVIERETFAGCPILEQVMLGNGLEEIADHAFTDCYMLRSLVLPASLQRLGIIGAVLDQGLFVRGEGTVLEGISLPFPTCHVEEFADEISFPPSLQQAVLNSDAEKDGILESLAYASMIDQIGGGKMVGLLVYNGNIEKGLDFERKVWSSLDALDAIETAAASEESDFLPTVYGHVGSSSQTFAEENSYPFVDISETLASGQCGDDAHWSLNGLGTLTISGTGPMWDYTIEEMQDGNMPEYYEYGDQITSVVFEDGITSIGEDTFVGLPIESVSISNSVEKIGPAAFSNCYDLEEVAIPGSVTEIEENAFEYCKSLQRVTLENGVAKLGTGVWIGCLLLPEIELPETVTDIGVAAFMNCDALQRVTIHSPDCVFLDELELEGEVYSDLAQYALPEATVIYGLTGSTSEAYAEAYQRQFVSIGSVHVHEYVARETKKATCSEVGVMTYTCACGDTYTEDIPMLEHNYTTETVPSDCTTHGYTRTYCTVGGEETERIELPLAEHTAGAPVKENETAATTEHGGSYDEVVRCTVCGAEISRVHKTTDPLPKQDDGSQPEKKLNFFQRLIEWIRNLFRSLFRR